MNPYFLVWWATIGAALISRAAAFGGWGIAVFAVVHWSCDFAWYSFLSGLSHTGGAFFGNKFQKIAFAVCGIFLAVFGLLYLRDGMRWAAN